MRRDQDGGRNGSETECRKLGGGGDCFKVDILFDNVDRSDRLKVFCTSMEKKFDNRDQSKAETSYEVQLHRVKCRLHDRELCIR